MLPVLMILFDLTQSKGEGLGRFVRAALLRYAPYLIVFCFYMAARVAVLGITAPHSGWTGFINNPLAYMSWEVRLLTAIKIAGNYLWLCVWPARLAADYSFDSIPMASSILSPGVLASMLAWIVVIALGLWSFAQGHRLIFIGAGLTFVTFIPASNILIPIGTIMGERLFYLPSAGLALLAAGGWSRLESLGRSGMGLRGYQFLWAGFLAATLLLTVRTIVRNEDWYDDETLFRSAALVVPRNAKVQHNLGRLETSPEKAVKHFKRSRKIYPDYVKNNERAAFYEGTAWLRADRLDEAIEMFELAARSKPKIDGLLFNLGFAYMKHGRWEDAAAAYQKAIELNVSDIRIHNNLSFVRWKQERFVEALEAADAAAGLDPDYSEAHYNRGAALEAMGRLVEAAMAYEQALKLKPGSSVAARLENVRRKLQTAGHQRR
jgi:tetratricopeptide (TPR) repeat protein